MYDLVIETPCNHQLAVLPQSSLWKSTLNIHAWSPTIPMSDGDPILIHHPNQLCCRLVAKSFSNLKQKKVSTPYLEFFTSF